LKGLFTTLACLVVTNALANCLVYVPTKEFLYAGHTIYIDFYSALNTKGYMETTDPSTALYELKFSGREISGRNFKHAAISFQLKKAETILLEIEDSALVQIVDFFFTSPQESLSLLAESSSDSRGQKRGSRVLLLGSKTCAFTLISCCCISAPDPMRIFRGRFLAPSWGRN
jgi:hypothetical protein